MKLTLDKYEPREGDQYAAGDGYGEGRDLYDSIDELADTVCERFVADGYDLSDADCLPDEIVVYRLLSNHDPEGVAKMIQELAGEVVEHITERLQGKWGDPEDDSLERGRAEAGRGLISSAVIGVVRTYSVQCYVPALYLGLPSGWWLERTAAVLAEAEAEEAARRAKP